MADDMYEEPLEDRRKRLKQEHVKERTRFRRAQESEEQKAARRIKDAASKRARRAAASKTIFIIPETTTLPHTNVSHISAAAAAVTFTEAASLTNSATAPVNTASAVNSSAAADTATASASTATASTAATQPAIASTSAATTLTAAAALSSTYLLKALRPFQPGTVKQHQLREMNIVCRHCNAKMWIQERKSGSSMRSPIFTGCCSAGKVVLPPLQNPPPVLYRLLTADNAEARDFRKNILRILN